MLFSPAVGRVTQTIASYNHTAVWCLQAAWLILKSFTLGSSFTHRHSHSAVVFYTTVLLCLHRAVQQYIVQLEAFMTFFEG